MFCNSHYTQERAKKLYDIGKVAYPKIADQYRYAGVSLKPMDYFVYVGRLVNFVRETWIIIKLFNELKLPLIIIGSGPDEEELKASAGNTIIFTGWNPEGMTEIIRDARGLVNLTKESFWIGTVEALLMGVPVFGFSEGATSELVDEASGILGQKQSMKHLKEEMHTFLKRKRDRKLIDENIRKKLTKATLIFIQFVQTHQKIT